MEEILDIIYAKSAFLAFASLSTGISFYALRNAYYKRKKVLCYAIKKGKSLAENDQAGNQSAILFWNRGIQTIRHDDFASQSPLRVMSDSNLFNAELLDSTAGFSQIVFSEVSGGFTISPEYMERDDAFVLRVDHEKDAELKVEGKLVGGLISRTRHLSFWYQLSFAIHLFCSMLIFAGYLLFWKWMTRYFFLDVSFSGRHEWLMLPIFFTTIILAVYLVISFDYNVRKVHGVARRHF